MKPLLEWRRTDRLFKRKSRYSAKPLAVLSDPALASILGGRLRTYLCGTGNSSLKNIHGGQSLATMVACAVTGSAVVLGYHSITLSNPFASGNRPSKRVLPAHFFKIISLTRQFTARIIKDSKPNGSFISRRTVCAQRSLDSRVRFVAFMR